MKNSNIKTKAQLLTEIDQLNAEVYRLKKFDLKKTELLENSPVCTKIVDTNFNLQYMSRSGIIDLKIDDITEFYGKPYPLHFYPDSFKIPMANNLKKVRETGKTISQEASILGLDGKELWFQSILVPVNDSKGQLDYIMVVSLNISKRKFTEISLKESEEKLKEALEITRLGTFSFDDSTNFFKTSTLCDEIIGIDQSYKKDIQGWINFVHPEDYKNAQLLLDKTNLESISSEFRIIRPKDKKIIWILGHAKKKYDHKGVRTKITGTIQDISKRKQAESNLRLSELRLREAQSVALIGSFDGDIYNDELWWSDELFNLFGLKPNEFRVTKDGFNQLIHPDEKDEYISNLMSCLETGNPFKKEFLGRHTNGEWRYFETVAGITYDTAGEILGMRGTVQDITERKLAEKEIRKTQVFNESLLNTSPDIIYVYDIIERKNIYSNKGILKILGYSVKEVQVLGESLISKLMHPDDFKIYLNEVVPRYQTTKDGEIIEHEYRMKHKEGNWCWLHSKESIFKRTDKGIPIHIFGITEDITKRKKVERDLKTSADRFERWKSSNFIGILQSNAKGDIIDANDTLLTMLGYSKQELAEGKLDWTKLTPPEFLHLDMAAIKEAEQKGFWTPFEKEYYHKDGHRIPIIIGGSLFEETQNEYIVFVINLTESKKADKDLKESEELLNLTGEIAKVGGWELDLESQKLNWSRETKRIHEVDIDFEPGLDTAINFYHPDDRDMVSKLVSNAINNAINNGEFYFFEARIITAKGNLKWVAAQGQVVLKNDKCVRLYGAFQDITKRKKTEEELEQYRKQLETENVFLKKEIALSFNYENMVYSSIEISDVLTQVEQVSSTNATVLILGETGTGKELIAKAIHNTSDRKDNSLIRVNCAAIPAELIESELFGHIKGSFTGAINNRIGKFELAHNGTLFLDEIGELPLTLQPKLLRAIQEGEIEPIGSSRIRKLDVRIIAATNKNLKKEAEEKRFREDLYFRLNVFPITIPPLRKRIEDIPILIDHFVSKYCKKHGKNIKYISDVTLQQMKSYAWPGNVRELENLIERAVIMSNQNLLLIEEFSNSSVTKISIKNHKTTLQEVQRNHIIKTLIDTQWKIDGKNGAALVLDIKPSTLRDRMKKFGIKKP